MISKINENLYLQISSFDENIIKSSDVQHMYAENFKTFYGLTKYKRLYHLHKCKFGNFIYLIYPLFLIFLLLISLLILSIFKFEHSSLYYSLLLASIVTTSIYIYIDEKLWEKHMKGGKNIYIKELNSLSQRYLSNEDNHFWIVMLNHKDTEQKELVGILGLKLLDEEHKIEEGLDPKYKVGYLEKMAVNIEFRGFGIAKKLVDIAIEFAKGRKYDILSLGAYETNIPALSLYKKYGFHTIRCYGNESIFEPKINVMIKRLNNN